MSTDYNIWLIFLIFITAMVALDLGFFHRELKVPSVRDATIWTLIWIGMAMLFNVAIYMLYENNYEWANLVTEHLNGRQAASQYFMGFILEKTLSIDNIFVMAMIFAYFHVPRQYQHRVLFWGILGAVILRGLMIAAGISLLNEYKWVTYIFGALLIYTAVKMLLLRHETVEPADNPLIKLFRRFLPITNQFHGSRFVVKEKGKWVATTLFLALIMIESSDVIFALDSIPAIMAVTRDPFIIFTSNIFAILGLRSLYFVLAGYMDRFRYLKQSLVFVLAFVGVKMMISNHYHIPNGASMALILGILSVGILASIMGSKKDPVPLEAPLD